MPSVNDWERKFPFIEIFTESLSARVLYVISDNYIAGANIARWTYLVINQVHIIVSNLEMLADQYDKIKRYGTEYNS